MLYFSYNYELYSTVVDVITTSALKGVIPNQFSKSLEATDSELEETWCGSSACGFLKPDNISLLCCMAS